MADSSNETPQSKKYKSREESKKAKSAVASSEKSESSASDTSAVLKSSLDVITAILKETNSFLKTTEKSISKISANTAASEESSKNTKENLRIIESRAKRTSAFLEATLESSKESKRKTKSIATNLGKIRQPVANKIEYNKETQIWRDKVVRLLSVIADKKYERRQYVRRKPTKAEEKDSRGLVANLVGGLTAFYAGKMFGTKLGDIIGNIVSKPITMLGNLFGRSEGRDRPQRGRQVYRGARAIARNTRDGAKGIGSKLLAGIGIAFELVKSLLGKIPELFSKIKGFIEKTAGMVKSLLGKLPEIFSKIKGFIEKTAEVVKSVLGKLPEMFSKIKGFIQKTAEIISKVSGKAYDIAKSIFNKIPAIFSDMVVAIEKGIGTIKNIIGGAFDFMKSLFGKGKGNVPSRLAAELSPTAKSGAKLTGRYAENVAGKAGAKGIAKGLLKSGGKILAKTAAKSIPLLGAAVGAGFAADRAMKGDWKGAAIELGSGIVGSTGIGAPVALAAEGYLAKRDYDRAEALTAKNVSPVAPKIETTKKLENTVSQSADLQAQKDFSANNKPIIIDNTKTISQGGKQPESVVRIQTRNTEPTKQFLDRLTISSSYMGTGFILT